VGLFCRFLVLVRGSKHTWLGILSFSLQLEDLQVKGANLLVVVVLVVVLASSTSRNNSRTIVVGVFLLSLSRPSSRWGQPTTSVVVSAIRASASTAHRFGRSYANQPIKAFKARRALWNKKYTPLCSTASDRPGRPVVLSNLGSDRYHPGWNLKHGVSLWAIVRQTHRQWQ
jgi:hypothetical protein